MRGGVLKLMWETYHMTYHLNKNLTKSPMYEYSYFDLKDSVEVSDSFWAADGTATSPLHQTPNTLQQLIVLHLTFQAFFLEHIIYIWPCPTHVIVLNICEERLAESGALTSSSDRSKLWESHSLSLSPLLSSMEWGDPTSSGTARPQFERLLTSLPSQ